MTQHKNYSQEQKLEIIKKSLPPEKVSMKTLSVETGIALSTLHTWKKKFKEEDLLLSQAASRSSWSSKDKFHIVMEAYTLSEAELGEYCRSKGIYVSEVKEWTKNCMAATNHCTLDPAILAQELKEQKIKAKQLEKELSRKEKALAEAAALLVLRKKAQAIWGEAEEDL